MAKLIGGPAHGAQVDTPCPTVIVPCESLGQYNRFGQRLWSYAGETIIWTIPEGEEQFISLWSANYHRKIGGNYVFSGPMTRAAYLHPQGCPDCDELREKIKA